jgi:two-component system, NarL family, nitrate/nitrite response regulator NarL
MDITMPGMTGLEATVLIRKKLPKARIIALTMHDNKDYVFEFIRLGAMGYVMKDANPDELIKAIETVFSDVPYYSSTVQKTILKQHAEILRKSKKSFIEETLTSREFDVLMHLVSGLSNKEIAKKLFLSVRTVETHREHIMKKLNIKNVAGLTKYAISQGLIDVK